MYYKLYNQQNDTWNQTKVNIVTLTMEQMNKCNKMFIILSSTSLEFCLIYLLRFSGLHCLAALVGATFTDSRVAFMENSENFPM